MNNIIYGNKCKDMLDIKKIQIKENYIKKTHGRIWKGLKSRSRKQHLAVLKCDPHNDKILYVQLEIKSITLQK